MSRSLHVWLASGLVALLGPAVCMAGPLLDSLRFGDSAAEQAHAVQAEGTLAATGALGEPCRRLQANSALVFALCCAPGAQNYLTVKLWGSDTEVATIFLYDGDKRIGTYGNALPELDLGSGQAAFPGRFYYVTYPVPLAMTSGKTSVRLKLAAVGAMSPYAREAKDREKPLRGPTRGLYRACTHTDPFFTPEPGEEQGTAPVPAAAPPAADAAPQIEANHRQIDNAVDKIRNWQLYGPDWQAKVKAGKAPAILTGATLRGLPPNGTPAQLQDAAIVRISDGNSNGMLVPGILALAWAAPWSRHCQNAELLDRIVAALDFYVLAQGSNGGFNSGKWVGAPKRQVAGHCLEGFGTQGLGRAALLTGAALAASGRLAETLDDDADAKTPAVPRRLAWTRMLAAHRDYLVSDRGRGHATNQDLAQIRAMWLCNEALRQLEPAQAWPRAQTLAYVEQATGLARNPMGDYWLTAKALALEPWGTLAGGYSGDYGVNCVYQVCDLAELTGDARIQQQARAALRAVAHFYVPGLDGEGRPCLRREGIVNMRNTAWPGPVDYYLDGYAAAVLQEPTALRFVQLWQAQGRQFEPLPDKSAHFLAITEARLGDAANMAKALSLPPTAARLPFEPDQADSAWADEQGGAIVVQHGQERLFLSLNWRRGFRDGKRDLEHAQTNDIARVHFTTPTIDRIATIAMKSLPGFRGLYLCRYGNYYVAQNASPEQSCTLPPPSGARTAPDLISGKVLTLDQPVRMPPQTTIVLYLGK